MELLDQLRREIRLRHCSIRTEHTYIDWTKRCVRRLTNRSWGVSMAERVRRLSRHILGWLGYHGLSEYKKPISELDGWIRRRVHVPLETVETPRHAYRQAALVRGGVPSCDRAGQMPSRPVACIQHERTALRSAANPKRLILRIACERVIDDSAVVCYIVSHHEYTDDQNTG